MVYTGLVKNFSSSRMTRTSPIDYIWPISRACQIIYNSFFCCCCVVVCFVLPLISLPSVSSLSYKFLFLLLLTSPSFLSSLLILALNATKSIRNIYQFEALDLSAAELQRAKMI